MACYICRQCGTQHADSQAPPAHCAICEDERQYVGWDGQDWLLLDELRARHRARFETEDRGLTGIGSEPGFAIGQRALYLETAHGNVLWDCVALIDDDIVARLEAKGGLAAIAISHPHFYTTMVEWSRAFGGVPIYLHADDRRWVQRPDPAIVHWTGATQVLSPALTLVRCGGHFDGATVLHWRDGADGRGAILSGDVLQVTQDRRHVSFMYSFPNYIPLNRAAVTGIRDSLAPFAFDRIFGAWWKRNVVGGARQAFDASVARYLAAIA